MRVYSEKKKLFGAEAEIVLFDVDDMFAKEVVESCYQEALRLHKIFNNYVDNSELSKLNKKRKLRVSDELIEVLDEAIKLCEITNGEFDISWGELFMKRKAGGEEPKLNCSYKDIKIDGNVVSLRHSDVQIDLSSIAKGYIADKMVAVLKSEGVESGYVDARGDVIIFGNFVQEIGIAHPREDKLIGYVVGVNLCVATSGDYMQYVDSFDKSHIINSKDIISATFVANSLMIADGFATSFFVSGKDAQKRLLGSFKNVDVLFISKDLSIEMSSGFKKIFREV